MRERESPAPGDEIYVTKRLQFSSSTEAGKMETIIHGAVPGVSASLSLSDTSLTRFFVHKQAVKVYIIF